MKARKFCCECDRMMDVDLAWVNARGEGVFRCVPHGHEIRDRVSMLNGPSEFAPVPVFRRDVDTPGEELE